MSGPPDITSWSCPIPLRDHPNVVMGHGGGGRLSAELIEHLFLPAFDRTPLVHVLTQLGDAAVLDLPGAERGARLAFTTDSYVVRPRFFPGGNIGDLAVNGTVNDLAVSGAVPLALSVGAILEEGMALDELGIIAQSMGVAARAAGVSIVTGDTKVVDSGHGDGLYLNTAGIGLVPAGPDLGPALVRPGDAVLLSGPIGMHGIAVLSVRDGLQFGADLVTDSAPVTPITRALLDAGVRVSMMRDPTRGGVAATLNEVAHASGTGIEIVERDVPVPDAVRAACGLLGLDPLYIANEGKVVVFVRDVDAERALELMRGTGVGRDATRIGTVTAGHPGVVVARTGIGGTRVVDLPLAEQLPRIC
ncbi:MAG: hydrogenase expression/formation protein HypE [Candidatus Nanopelagicales bacterium]|jgi:hydrogenase expression/formation protein HypE|nr:hydrogenase expression/formation protein HypE [Candidatus Nanopelagicales bacterium]